MQVQLVFHGRQLALRAVHARPATHAFVGGRAAAVAVTPAMTQQLVHCELVGQVGARFRAQHRGRWFDRVNRVHRIDDRLALRQGRVGQARVRRGRQFRAQVPAAVGRILEQEVLVLPTHGAAAQVELRIGRTAHADQLDALVGLRARAAGVEHAHVGLAIGITGDDQLVGGRVVVTEMRIEGQRAAVAGEGIHAERVEAAAITQCYGTGAAQGEVADIAVAGHQPGAVGVNGGAGDVEETAIDLGVVAQEDRERAIDGGRIEGDVACQTRVIHAEGDVGLANVRAGQGLHQKDVSIAAANPGVVAQRDVVASVEAGRHDPDGRAPAGLHQGVFNTHCNRIQHACGSGQEYADIDGKDL
ncbi:hypothetical protein D3C71_714590 [compost metagenome]